MLQFRLIVVLLLTMFCAPAEAKRVALVIANSRYTHTAPLKNPAADARLIAGALRASGFDSVEQLSDLDKAGLEAALQKFGKRAEAADVALIYYAGHGIEAGGENYLIPTDAKLERDRDLDVEATPLETALRMGSGARMRIVILDACRNNPFLASMQRAARTRAVARGLAAIEPEGETLVVYAAKAGATAADGAGENSPFASALAQRMVQPGLEIGIMFRSVRDDVLKRTNREQEPFTYGSLSGDPFYFVPPKAGTQVASGSAQATSSDESLFWQSAIAANTLTSYREYLAKYPSGQFAGLAREAAARLTSPGVGGASGLAIAQPQGTASVSPLGVGQSPFDNGVFPNLSRAFTDNGYARLWAGTPEEAVARYAFKPDRKLRSQLREQMLSSYGKRGSQNRAPYDLLYPEKEPFRIAMPFAAQYGLSFDNAADATFAMFESYRRQGTEPGPAPTLAEVYEARKQIAAAMRRDPFFKDMTGKDLQIASDRIWFAAAANIQIENDLSKDGRNAQEKHRAKVVSAIEAVLGIPIANLRLTGRGYQIAPLPKQPAAK